MPPAKDIIKMGYRISFLHTNLQTWSPSVYLLMWQDEKLGLCHDIFIITS